MKVIISAVGKFHIFDLAQQLLKRDALARLITSYPKFEVAKYGIPRNKTRSLFIKEILQRSWLKLPLFLRKIYNPEYLIHELFDVLASHSLIEGDIFVGGSSTSLRTIRRAHAMGMLTVLEHGSSHILYRDKILEEEYEKYGISLSHQRRGHPKSIEKELEEYEVSDYIAVPSTYAKRTFVESGISEKKIIQTPYGFDLLKFWQVPKKDNIFRIIFGGGLSLRKGTHYLLKAFSELKLPNAELLLIGAINPEIIPFLEKYKGNYKHITYRPINELYKFYSQGSVFVMPSIEEGLAMVQPQAMACGLPVICTTNTGGEDIIRDGKDGFIIPIRDVDKLKEKILYLYDNSEVRQEMGKSAKERVISGFTWDDYGRKIISAYENILGYNKK
ncbi:MAG: glycosyltransferase family 4 protein [Patescibacteria group bacterium]